MTPVAGPDLEAVLARARDVFDNPLDEDLLRLAAELESLLANIDPGTAAEPWGTAWARLADARNLLAGRRSDPQGFEEALAAYEKALEITPRGALWDRFQLNRLMALDSYARLKGDLETFRSVQQQARAVTAGFDDNTEPSIRIAAEQRLGISELSLGGNTGDLALLEQALDRFERLEDFARTHQAHGDAVRACINQGLIGRSIAELSGDPEPLQKAVETLERVVAELTLEEQPDLWAMAAKNLGQALSRLGEFTHDRTALWRSVTSFDDCRQVWSRERAPNRWADLQMQRALPLQMLGEMAEDPALLADAIASYDAAIAVLSAEETPIDWAIAHMNRGNTLRSLGEASGADGDWAAAIASYEEALQTYGKLEAPVRLTKTRANMAVTELLSGQRRCDAAALMRADDHLAAIWEICERDKAAQLWAGLRVFRGRTALALGGLTGAADHYERAQSWFGEAATVFAPEKISSDWIGLQMHLAQLDARLKNWPAVDERIADLLGATFTAVVAAASWQVQNEIIWLVRGAADLGALARLKQDDPAGAWDILFSGRRIQQAAQRALALLHGESGGQVTALRTARAAWIDASNAVEAAQRLAAGPDPSREARQRLADAKAALAKATKTLKDLQPQVMPSPKGDADAADPAKRAGPDDPGVAMAALLVTDLGGACLIRAGGDVSAHDLPGLTTANLDRLLRGPATSLGSDDPLLESFGGWLPAYRAFKEAGLSPSNRSLHAWNDTIAKVLEILGPVFAEPLDAALSARLAPGSAVVLLPPGRMAVLPLQAARLGTSQGDPGHLGERWSISVAPDPGSLSVRVQSAAPAPGSRRLLAVSPLEPNAETVPAWRSFSGERRESLCGSAATCSEVTRAAGRADYVSFLSHGVSDAERSERSGLELADARLTLADIRHLDLRGTRLFCLTACESGLVDTRLAPDEFHGLPTELLSAGAPAVVATLWMVDRRSAVAVTDRFFASHLEGLTPASALADAQREACRRGAESRAEPAPRATPESQRGTSLLGFGGPLEAQDRDDAPLPPDAPFHWAGFVLYGL